MAEELVAGLGSLSMEQSRIETEDTNMESGHDQDRAGQLQNHEQARLLDLINGLRSLGVGDHVSLPQLIVVGDQSSGKSSVLEAISGFHFPVKDDLCTTFATEINLRPADHECASVTIDPHSGRSPEQKRHLTEFLKPDVSIADLPTIINDAKVWIARTPKSRRAGVFAEDVLKVTVSKPNLAPLTLVDLPGIIQSESGEQTAEDVRTVENLVNSYMKNKHSIILAVISARNDVQNQIVLKWAREHDKNKQRTLGIITKPDLLKEEGPDKQKRIVNLAKNKEDKCIFDLGWHVVRNRDYQSRESSMDERDATERQFFETGVWSTLPRGHVGVDSLRARLQRILCKIVQGALPKILTDISQLITNTEEELSKLGKGQPSIDDKRYYLSRVADGFQELLREGIHGAYQDGFFRDDESGGHRFRAEVVTRSTNFSLAMRIKGHSKVDKDSYVSQNPVKVHAGCYADLPSPQIVDYSEMEQLARKVLERNKQGLPDLYDSYAVNDLFRQLAQPWQSVARAHVRDMCEFSKSFLEAVIDVKADPACAGAIKVHCIEPKMKRIYSLVEAKVDEVVRPFERGRPATENPRFSQVRGTASTIWSGLTEYTAPDTWEKGFLKAAWAYYEISFWTFVDNIMMLVVQQTLIDNLADVFSSPKLVGMDDDTIKRLANEPAEQEFRRESLQAALVNLREGLQRCQQERAKASQFAVSHSACATAARTDEASSRPSPSTPDRGGSRHLSPQISVSTASSSPLSQRQSPSSSFREPETPITSDDEAPAESTKKSARFKKQLFN